MSINWVDILLVLVIFLALIAGWRRGFMIGLLDLITWLGSVVVGYLFYSYTAMFLGRFIKMGPWQLPVAFIITTLIARILIGFITGYIRRSIPARANDNSANKFLGIIPGFINGIIYAIILSALLL